MSQISINDEGPRKIASAIKKHGLVLSRVSASYDLGRDLYGVRFDVECPCGGRECVDLLLPPVEFAALARGAHYERIAGPLVSRLIAHIKDEVERAILPAEWLAGMS